MIERVEIKYTYDHHEKSNICMESVHNDLLVPVMIFIKKNFVGKSGQLVQ